MNHDHAQPGIPEQQATLALYRAVLTGDPGQAAAAAAAPCGICLAIAATQFGAALAMSVQGEPFMSEELRGRLLAAVNVAETELRAAPN